MAYSASIPKASNQQHQPMGRARLRLSVLLALQLLQIQFGCVSCGVSQSSDHPSRVMRICVATHGLVGPVRSGGIATFSTELALLLAAAHQNVTVLYLAGAVTDGEPMADWVTSYAQQGVHVAVLTPGPGPLLQASAARRISYEGMLWLQARQSDFDVVYFHDWRGSGFYPMMYKRLGLGFHHMTMIMGMHSPTLWSLSHARQPIDSLDLLEMNFLERESAQLADLVVAPSHYMLTWARAQGWQLSPQTTRVLHNPMHRHWAFPTVRPRVFRPTRHGGIHLVFFGRLEERKGLVLFCEALAEWQLLPSNFYHLRVTFLGKAVSNAVGRESTVGYLARVTSHWPTSPAIIDQLNTAQALAFLEAAGPETLVVIPSLVGEHAQ